MIRFRDDGHEIHQGLNVYPFGSYNWGFVLALGRYRWMLRYSRVTGNLHCYVWKDKRCGIVLDL